MFKHRTFKNHAKLKQLTQKKYTYNTCIVIVVFFYMFIAFFQNLQKKMGFILHEYRDWYTIFSIHLQENRFSVVQICHVRFNRVSIIARLLS